MKIIEQADMWVRALRLAGDSLDLEGDMAESDGDERAGKRLSSHAATIRSTADDIERRFVEGKSREPKTRGPRKTQNGKVKA